MENLPTASVLLTRFLRLFYINDPSTTTFKTMEEVPNYISQAIPFFIATIIFEVLFYIFLDPEGLKSHDGDNKWEKGKLRINDMITSISSGSVQQISPFFLFGLEMPAYLYVWDNYRIMNINPTALSTWILGFLLVDLAYYWFHRMAHEVALFWAFHSIHHSSEYYNQSTALRQSILQTYSSWMFYLPVALVLPPPMFLVHKHFNTIYQYWIHTDTIRPLPFPLEYIINTPSAHRVHHGRNRYCIDRNYAGFLNIWDIMFGTYQQERVPPNVPKEKEERVCYGITTPINTFDPMQVQIIPLIGVFKAFTRAEGVVDKFKSLFYGPGWYRLPNGKETPRTGLLTDIPEILQSKPPVKFDPKISLFLTVYCVLQSLATTLLVAISLENKDKYFIGTLQLITLWIFFSSWTVGIILNGTSPKSSLCIEIGRNFLAIFAFRALGLRDHHYLDDLAPSLKDGFEYFWIFSLLLGIGYLFLFPSAPKLSSKKVSNKKNKKD